MMTIAIFDSGAGGLTVLKTFLNLSYPSNYIYFADYQHLPYGEKEAEVVSQYVLDSVKFLAEKKIDVLVVACNTATSLAIKELRHQNKFNFPIFGMEPAVKLAVDQVINLEKEKKAQILITATNITANSQQLTKLKQRFSKRADFETVVLGELVKFVENNCFDKKTINNYLRKNIDQNKKFDAIVLGCTHFSFFKENFKNLFPKSLNLVKNSEVLVQAFTCEAVVLPVLAVNLSPRYIDIEDETWSMDINDLKAKITKQSRVLILQHSFAMLPRDREKILQLAKKYNLIVIEDLAHGFTPQLLNDQFYPSSKLLSFGRSKFFSAVYGGAIIVEPKFINAQFTQSIAQLEPVTNQFIRKVFFYKILAPIIKSTYNWGGKLFHALFNYLGFFNHEISNREKTGNYDKWLNKALPDVFAKLLLEQIQNYPRIYKDRQQIAQLYWQEFSQNIAKNNLPSLRYPLLIDQADLFLTKMAKQGYILGNWYRQVVAPPELDLAKVKYQEASCPMAEQMSQKVINLPLNIGLKQTKKLLEVLIDVKKNFN